MYTRDTVNIATGRTEQRAVWGKGEASVLTQIKAMQKCSPFHYSDSIAMPDQSF
jgi:hypothetical protein